MEMFSNFFILFSFFVEVAFLFYLETKTWGTLYTPLNFLMLPYSIVLIITLFLAGNFGFVELYYPSILFWSIGLLLFAIPSYGLGYLITNYPGQKNSVIEEKDIPGILVIIAILVGAALLFQFYRTLATSNAFVGSDDFAEEFSGHGLWAHIRQLSVPLIIVCIYFLSKRRWWIFPILLCLLIANLINQVKGTIVITVISGMAIRLYAGKTKLNWRFITTTIGGGLILFFISYLALPLLGKGESKVSDEQITFVFNVFGHYLTSGILGLSEDMVHNYPDMSVIDIILSPFINIYNQIAGIDDIISPVNPKYYDTGHNLTNVRTFFGTLYIYTNWLQFVLYTLSLSSLLYLIKLCTMKYNNIFIYTIYFYECSLLAMGWFEFYFFHLAAIEIPILSLFLLLACRIRWRTESLFLPYKK